MSLLIALANFVLWNPLGETILLIMLGVYLWYAHQNGKVHGRAYLEIIGFILATIVGLWIPTVVVFLAALFYVVARIRRARQERARVAIEPAKKKEVV